MRCCFEVQTFCSSRKVSGKRSAVASRVAAVAAILRLAADVVSRRTALQARPAPHHGHPYLTQSPIMPSPRRTGHRPSPAAPAVATSASSAIMKNATEVSACVQR